MFIIRPAVSLADAEGMRRVRNACRDFMTRDTRSISRFRQLIWWARRPDTLHPFVVKNGTIVGYGIVLEEGTQAGLTGALLPSARGHGVGTALFQRLIDFAEDRSLSPWLEVLESNLKARALYKKLGFVEESRNAGVIGLRRHQRTGGLPGSPEPTSA